MKVLQNELFKSVFCSRVNIFGEWHEDDFSNDNDPLRQWKGYEY